MPNIFVFFNIGSSHHGNLRNNSYLWGMLRKYILTVIALLLTCGGYARSFEVGKESFLLDGKPYIVKAAELHYPRIPEQYWEHRIQMCKALGMNTICLYVFWNLHETEQGKFDFRGPKNLRKFVELCRDNGMDVILRPGPYVCAEWEMGGLPWWLLKNPDIRLREGDPRFMKAVENFEREVARQVSDLTVANGGPILMVQVENEYGSYGIDKSYVGAIRDLLKELYPGTVLFQCDWSSNFLNNGLDDTLWTLNFGTGSNIDDQFAPLKQARPDTPLMCSEFWSGWFDKWGAGHETRPADDMIAGLTEMVDKGISFSLYMTHGGTNWSHWAGANSPGYAPDVTSYDYDAPISESGRTTEKYFKLRDALAKRSNVALPAIPDSIPTMAIDRFSLQQVAPLWANIPGTFKSDSLLAMEQCNQGFGSMLYSTMLPPMPDGAVLKVAPHDFAIVRVDGKIIGTLDRRIAQDSISLPPTAGNTKLEIFVEAMGRLNFGRVINDRKGIVSPVLLIMPGKEQITLKGWDIALLPDTTAFYDSLTYQPVKPADKMPGVYRGSFTISGKPADTFLDFSSWGKGLVYVNGHGLGRIWNIGPQQTLYTPGCWLNEGENEIIVFDILGPDAPVVRGLRTPILDQVANLVPDEDADFTLPTSPTLVIDLKGDRWLDFTLPAQAKGNRLAIELPGNGTKLPSIAEIIILDEQGNQLPRESWKLLHYKNARLEGNHTPDKAFDLQESTFWQAGEPGKAYFAVDLTSNQKPAVIKILPKMAPQEHFAANIYLF